MLSSPTQSTEVLCAGMEIPVNPVMLVSRWKLLPGLNDDCKGFLKNGCYEKIWNAEGNSKEWLWSDYVNWDSNTRHTQVFLLLSQNIGEGEGGEKGEWGWRLRSRQHVSHGMLLQCVQPLLDYMGHMGFKSWCYSHQEYLYYSGDPKPFTKKLTITHYFSIVERGWEREVVVVVVVVAVN